MFDKKMLMSFLPSTRPRIHVVMNFGEDLPAVEKKIVVTIVNFVK